MTSLKRSSATEGDESTPLFLGLRRPPNPRIREGQMTLNGDAAIKNECTEMGILKDGICLLDHEPCRVCGTGRELLKREESRKQGGV